MFVFYAWVCVHESRGLWRLVVFDTLGVVVTGKSELPSVVLGLETRFLHQSTMGS